VPWPSVTGVHTNAWTEVFLNPYASHPYEVPISRAPVDARVSFLRHVGLLTFGGLATASITGAISMVAILAAPEILMNRFVMLAVVFGAMFGTQAIGSSIGRTADRSGQLARFVAGTALEGVAFGYLFVIAAVGSAAIYGNPLVVLGQASVIVGLSVLGMVAYLMTGPKNLSLIGSAIAVMGLPMLGLMVFSAVFPIGGTLGLLLSVGFVVMSGGALLYNLNHVMHTMSTSQPVSAAFHVTLGILTFFWNVVMLLLKLQRR
jgi:FtsH-binding integral membrane protein